GADRAALARDARRAARDRRVPAVGPGLAAVLHAVRAARRRAVEARVAELARAVVGHEALLAGAAAVARHVAGPPAAVEVGLVAVLHAVRARRRLADVTRADAALAVVAGHARLADRARPRLAVAEGAAAVDVRLLAVLHAVRAARRHARVGGRVARGPARA